LDLRLHCVAISPHYVDTTDGGTTARMETTQAKLEATSNAEGANVQEMMKEMKDKIKEDMNTNRKADQEDLKEMMKK
jgi:phytoene dehydrogenase-like protein